MSASSRHTEVRAPAAQPARAAIGGHPVVDRAHRDSPSARSTTARPPGRAHPAARPARRAERARRHDALEGRRGRRHRDACAASTSTCPSTRSSSTRSSRSTRTASRPTSSRSPTSSPRPASCSAPAAPSTCTPSPSLVPTAANAGYYASIVAETRAAAPPRRGRHAHRADGLRGRGRGHRPRQQRPGRDLRRHRRRSRARTTCRSPRRSTAAIDEIEAAQAARDGKMTGVPTGFAELDELTNGLHPGQLIIVAARPALGKSTLALDFARAAVDQARPAVDLLLARDGHAARSRCACSRAEASVPLQMHAQGHASTPATGPRSPRRAAASTMHRSTSTTAPT